MKVNGDEEVTRFLPYATWRSTADAVAWFERMAGLQAAGSTLQFTVVERATDTPVGTCLLFGFDEPSARAELGFVLGRAHWGQGYMAEAMAALIACAFGPMGLRRLVAQANPRNLASVRLLQRLGFVHEGSLRKHAVGKGELQDAALFGLLREEPLRADAHAPRLAPIDPPYPPEIQAEFDRLMRGAPPLLFFRTVAHNPRVLQRLMAASLLDKGSLTLRQRELVILRTCARCGAEYEWGVHVAAFGGQARWTEPQLRSTVHGLSGDACWTSEETLLIGLADQLHDTRRVDDALWQELATRFAPDQLVELTVLAGLYQAVSVVANALRVQHEASAPRFPAAPTWRHFSAMG